MAKVKRLGIPKNVWETSELREYVQQPYVGGYVGARGRTKTGDYKLVRALRKKGLGPKMVATWLTSGSGRHLMDSDQLTAKGIKNYTKDVAKQVIVWTDPRHTGTLASTLELRKQLSNKLIKRRLKELG